MIPHRQPITGRTRIVGVIGHPVGHSLSPAMQNAAFDALGMDYRYVAFDVAPGDVGGALAGMRALGLAGLNVTIPHKTAVYELVDDRAPSAEAVRAVNTVELRDGRAIGHNTDGEGFARSLSEAGVPLRDQRVVLLGAGGAARSVAAALQDRGAASLTILNRTRERAVEMIQWLDERARAIPGGGKNTLLSAGTPDEGESSIRSASIVVQCTSVGMSPHQEDPPPIPASWIQPSMVVYDLIYNPRETRLLALARAAGAKAMNGVEMLIYQGAIAFEIWTGVFPPIDVMRRALLEALGE
ncbi:MAG TPA: shikimate dehydrogenase [Armatimonadota bacterium]|nr:shikimate dehydrogenase [Armatimonadota bacterium]